MRGAASRLASTTRVIREMPSASVWPTVSESMLYPRRRRSDAMRFSTHGRSAACATNVSMSTTLHHEDHEAHEDSLGFAQKTSCPSWPSWSERDWSLVCSRLRERRRRRAADHRVQVRAGRHHRVDRVFLLDLEINDDRA